MDATKSRFAPNTPDPMGVRRGGKRAFAPPGNWNYEAKIL